MALPKISYPELYEHDYYAWIREQVRALREHRVEEVDWENVAEEIDDLGKTVRWSVESHLETLVEHLLKLAYARETVRTRNARLWEGTIRLARYKIHKKLAQNPSLRSILAELFADAYGAGRIKASARMRLLENCMPATPPWTLEQALDDSFVPKPAS